MSTIIFTTIACSSCGQGNQGALVTPAGAAIGRDNHQPRVSRPHVEHAAYGGPSLNDETRAFGISSLEMACRRPRPSNPNRARLARLLLHALLLVVSAARHASASLESPVSGEAPTSTGAGVQSPAPSGVESGPAPTNPVTPPQTPAVTTRPHAKYGIGLRGGYSPETGVAAFLLGLDLAYSPVPLFAFGLEYERFVVDNGSDAHHYCIACLRSGTSWRGFGEIRPFADYPVFPFARASAGLSRMDIIGRPNLVVGPALGIGGGVEGRLRPVYLRVIGFATAQLGGEPPVRRSHLAGLALEVGAVF